jgi:hypothetical protein
MYKAPDYFGALYFVKEGDAYMQNVNMASSDSEMIRAPFAGCNHEKRSILIRLGIIKANDAPNEVVISFIARSFAVIFTDSFQNGSNNDDSFLFFIYDVLCKLRDKNGFHTMYFFVALYSFINLKYVPKELVHIACRADLLSLYMKHFISEYRKLVGKDKGEVDEY